MIPLVLIISGMLVYEMSPYQGAGEGIVRIAKVTDHTPYFVFNPDDFDEHLTHDFLADPKIADLITLPDGTQRARIELKDKRLEIAPGSKMMTAKWKGMPGSPVYDETVPDTLDWVPSFKEMSGAAQTFKGDADFDSFVSIGIGNLTSAGHPMDPMDATKIYRFKFLDMAGAPCTTTSISDHGLARSLVLKADGTGLVILLKDKSGTNILAAGKMVEDRIGPPVEMSITNFPTKLKNPPSSPRQEHLHMLFQAALKNSPAADKVCLPSEPPGTVTGSSAFCPPMQP